MRSRRRTSIRSGRRRRSRRWRRGWCRNAVIKRGEQTLAAGLSRDGGFLCIVVWSALNARLGDAAVRISDQHTALVIDGRVDEVEQVSIVGNATANDRA